MPLSLSFYSSGVAIVVARSEEATEATPEECSVAHKWVALADCGTEGGKGLSLGAQTGARGTVRPVAISVPNERLGFSLQLCPASLCPLAKQF